ncbi:MAG TPA: hypothetical protein VE076_07200 [Nitrososphaeraceae archaeon]|nr:hypothetical protein [Nitrososphaeraceae archaeon]
MVVKLNKRAYKHAKNLISEGKCVQDEKDEWSNTNHLQTRKTSSLRKMDFLNMGSGI